jgi:hypothetical protein
MSYVQVFCSVDYLCSLCHRCCNKLLPRRFRSTCSLFCQFSDYASYTLLVSFWFSCPPYSDLKLIVSKLCPNTWADSYSTAVILFFAFIANFNIIFNLSVYLFLSFHLLISSFPSFSPKVLVGVFLFKMFAVFSRTMSGVTKLRERTDLPFFITIFAHL